MRVSTKNHFAFERAANIAALFLFAAAIGSSWISLSSGHESVNLITNSDALYLPALFDDILTGGGSLADWQLPHAPSFFPDYAFYYLAKSLATNVFQEILIFSVVQIVVTFFAIYLLMTILRVHFALVLAVTIMISLIAFSLGQGHRSAVDYLFVSAHHYSVFHMSLLIVALWHGRQVAVREPYINWTIYGVMLAIGFLASLSDSIFIPQTAAPMLATVFILKKDETVLRSLALRGILVWFIVCAAGVFSLGFVIHKSGLSMGISISPLNFLDFFKIIFVQLLRSPVYGLTFLAYLWIVGWALVSLKRIDELDAGGQRLVWITVYSVMGMVSMLLAITVFTILPTADRYMIQVFSWPVVVVSLAVVRWAPSWVVLAATSVSAVAATTLGLQAYALVGQNGFERSIYPEEIACVDRALAETDARRGIANYWDTKRFRTFSVHDLILARHGTQLQRVLWIDSARTYRDRYDFAIISYAHGDHLIISTERVVSLNGEPKQIVDCGTRLVMIYDKDGLAVSE